MWCAELSTCVTGAEAVGYIKGSHGRRVLVSPVPREVLREAQRRVAGEGRHTDCTGAELRVFPAVLRSPPTLNYLREITSTTVTRREGSEV